MKGCLKSPTPSPGLNSHAYNPCPTSSCRKTVAFGKEISEEVYFADVWDRTPTEPARKLTYQDLLELKEIQRSLPRADQPPDPVSGKPAEKFLNQVPIGLLPLLTDSEPSTPSPVASPPSTPTVYAWTPRTKAQPPPSTQWVPPHLQHLVPSRTAPQRQKQSFAFLPLLETPPSSAASSPYPSSPSSRDSSLDRYHSDTDHSSLDPPTPSLTHASLDSSPPSRASSLSASPEPSFLSLADADFDYRGRKGLPPSFSRARAPGARESSPSYINMSNTTAWHAFPNRSKTLQARAPSISPQRSDSSSASDAPRKQNVMIVNGIEIPLDDEDEDDDDDEDATPPPTSTTPPARIIPGLVPLLPPISISLPAPAPVPRTPPRARAQSPQSTSTPQLSCSPSSPGRCAMSLLSPVCFQREKKRTQGYAAVASSPWAG
ncbi:hypothetical protein H0H92_004286 [Tricholoma furcatifolium]|nr:hypothetical protein H0H92_004286 [Tricholoma furcatifolium]